MFQQTIYGLADPLEAGLIRYIGRTTTPDMRLRFHAFNPFNQDGSPRGLWVAYLAYAGRVPKMTVIENSEFPDKSDAERWSKDREKHWISEFVRKGEPIVNREGWWTTSDRKEIPKGVRAAWESLHTSLFWLDHAHADMQIRIRAVDLRFDSIMLERKAKSSTLIRTLSKSNEIAEDYCRGRRGLLHAISSLGQQYPSIKIAPIKWLESIPESESLDGWELSLA